MCSFRRIVITTRIGNDASPSSKRTWRAATPAAEDVKELKGRFSARRKHAALTESGRAIALRRTSPTQRKSGTPRRGSHGVDDRSALRHGSAYVLSRLPQNIDLWGMSGQPAFIRDPEGNAATGSLTVVSSSLSDRPSYTSLDQPMLETPGSPVQVPMIHLRSDPANCENIRSNSASNPMFFRHIEYGRGACSHYLL